MTISWKTSRRFQPKVVLERIASIRKVNAQGGAEFGGFEIHDCLPALHSMLDFPKVVAEIDSTNLVWRGLAGVKGELTTDAFLEAINAELSRRLSTKDSKYFLLTSLSLDHRDHPKRFAIGSATIAIHPHGFPARFKSRIALLRERRVLTPNEPRNYCRAIVEVTAKSPEAAANQALRTIDLSRSLLCLMGNPVMQLAFGGPELLPINVVRLGGTHTIHKDNGEPASDTFWFEPNFREASIYRPRDAKIIQKNLKWAIRILHTSSLGHALKISLVQFVRAFDEPMPSTAFLRLWAALENLVTPGIADYEKMVRRCASLFAADKFHTQLLEHLREYRNSNIHTGEDSQSARTHCYQLQLYYAQMIWFYLRNATFFSSLEEANTYLDLPAGTSQLMRKAQLVRKALKFRTLSEAATSTTSA